MAILDRGYAWVEDTEVSRAHSMARTAMIILTGAMIAIGFNMMLFEWAESPPDINLSDGIASVVRLYSS